MNYRDQIRTFAMMAIVITAFLSPAIQGKDSAAREWRVSENLSVVEIGHGVWIHTSWHELSNGIRFPGNGLIVQYEDELLLIDTAWGVEATTELLDWIDMHLEMPVSQAIVTHYHADSMGGTPALAARGVPFFGSSLTRRLGQDEGAPLPESLGELQIGDMVPIGNVEVFYPGAGHSEDNLVVWVPHARVLFGTCAMRTPQFPGRGNTADADLAEWPNSMRRILSRYPDAAIVVPGHGDPGDISLLPHTIGLFDE